MVADTSEAAVWSLSDALLERDRRRAPWRLRSASSLRGKTSPALIYALASRLRKANAALTQLESGVAAEEGRGRLGMHPYAAKQLVARLRDPSLGPASRGYRARRRPRGLVPRAARTTATGWP